MAHIGLPFAENHAWLVASVLTFAAIGAELSFLANPSNNWLAHGITALLWLAIGILWHIDRAIKAKPTMLDAFVIYAALFAAGVKTYICVSLLL